MSDDFLDPAPILAPAAPAPREPLLPIHPATSRRFEWLDEHGATAHLDSVRTGEPMTPSAALETAAGRLPEDGYRRIVITPRRGTPFVLNLWRTRGLVRFAA